MVPWWISAQCKENRAAIKARVRVKALWCISALVRTEPTIMSMAFGGYSGLRVGMSRYSSIPLGGGRIMISRARTTPMGQGQC